MKSNQTKTPPDKLSRRKFVLAGSAVATAFTILPRHVLGGAGFVPPSEKILLAHIGCGTQGLRELPGLLNLPDVQIIAVCDPVKESYDYVDWSRDGLRAEVAAAIGLPDWRKNAPGIPGGRDVAKEAIEIAYARQRSAEKFRGCKAYADFRELLDKETDVNAVKIMTPDHLHATVAVAAMRKGKHVMMHKPLANRLLESRLVIDTARKTKVATHFLPASDGSNVRKVKAWIDAGAIGNLREIHNWSNRPVWPQYPSIPQDSPPVPAGFDWSLWLGPSTDRPYHPHYTHAVFRGWYEFGGGALADMGHYSLWPVFQAFDLDSPVSVESNASHLCTLDHHVAVRVKNDFSFPAASTVRFEFAPKGQRSALSLFWYDGSMKPQTPAELDDEQRQLEPEGMLFIGDKGKILCGFHADKPRLLPTSKMAEWADKLPATSDAANPNSAGAQRSAPELWVSACKGGQPTYGDFLLAGPISDAFNLGAVSLRLGGRRLTFDAPSAKVKNLADANKYLGRDYRPGWELT